MDLIGGVVLSKLSALGAPGRYFVVSEDEFFENFPAEAEKNGDALKKAVQRLNSAGYVDLRYSGGGMYCLSLLKKYEPEPEPEPGPAEGEAIYTPAAKKKSLPTFWAAFLGGALGGAATALLSLLFLLC